MSESITLTQHMLGMRPYVLIEAKIGPDGPDDLRLVVTGGGGPESAADLAEMMAMALAEMPAGMDLMRRVVTEWNEEA